MRILKLLVFLFIVLGGMCPGSGSLLAHALSGNGISFNHYTPSDSIHLESVNNPNSPELLTFLPSSKSNQDNKVYVSSADTKTPSEISFRSPFETKFSLFQNPYIYSSHPTLYQTRPPAAFTLPQSRINYNRAAIFGVGNASAVFYGFKQAMTSWGKSNGRFHIKDDWTGDRLAQTDELSHFMWGYKMTQFFFWTYDWIGLSPKTSQLLSMVESALILTAVEYPVDAYNPKQGLGMSDLIFDYLGVGLAFAKKHQSWFRNVDFKISWKKNIFVSNHSAFAQTYEEYDNFIYWLTCRTNLFLPQKIVCFGLGYSVTHVGNEPGREFYCGIGLSLSDFVSLFGKKLKKHIEFLDLLYPNLKLKL